MRLNNSPEFTQLVRRRLSFLTQTSVSTLNLWLAHSRHSISNMKWMRVPVKNSKPRVSPLVASQWRSDPAFLPPKDLWDSFTLLKVSMVAAWGQPELMVSLICQLWPWLPVLLLRLEETSLMLNRGVEQRRHQCLPPSVRRLGCQREGSIVSHLLSVTQPKPSAEHQLGTSHLRAPLAIHRLSPNTPGLGQLPGMAVVYDGVGQSPLPWPLLLATGLII